MTKHATDKANQAWLVQSHANSGDSDWLGPSLPNKKNCVDKPDRGPRLFTSPLPSASPAEHRPQVSWSVVAVSGLCTVSSGLR